MPGRKFEWMRQRAKQLWPDWIKAGERFAKLKQKWKKKRVCIEITYETGHSTGLVRNGVKSYVQASAHA